VNAGKVLAVALMLGLGVAAFGAQNARAADEPSFTDVTALAAYITQQVVAAPSLAAQIAGRETARYPAYAAAIATAAVNAAPNYAQDIVDAVLAALPDDMKNDPILTAALGELGREGGHPAFDPTRLGAPLIAPWTDPQHRTLLVSNPPPNASPR
jgi:hypothetical protein